MRLNLLKGMLYLFLALFVISACNSNSLNYDRKIFEDIEFGLTKSTGIVNESNSGKEGHYENFTLVIQPKSKAQLKIAEENSETLQLKLQSAFSLITETDTIPCTFYHMEPKFVDGSYRAVVSFELGKKSNAELLTVLFDAYLFDKSILKFKISNT